MDVVSIIQLVKSLPFEIKLNFNFRYYNNYYLSYNNNVLQQYYAIFVFHLPLKSGAKSFWIVIIIWG